MSTKKTFPNKKQTQQNLFFSLNPKGVKHDAQTPFGLTFKEKMCPSSPLKKDATSTMGPSPSRTPNGPDDQVDADMD